MRKSMQVSFYCVLLMLVLAIPINSDVFNLSMTDKHGATLNSQDCNKNTILNFYLNPASTISCTSASCTVISPELSSAYFLDVGGSEDTYILQTASIYQVSGATTRPEEKALVNLEFMSSSGKNLYVGIPFSQTISSTTTPQLYEFNLNNVGDSAYYAFRDTSLSTPLPLSAFNFLNRRDFGYFYTIANSASSPTETYLLTYFIMSNSKIASTSIPTQAYNFPDALSFTANAALYAATGDKICWGADSEGIFQTHMRESYPLWTAIIGLLAYWIYYLLSEPTTNECFDKKFQDNKWTSWGFYSLHYLAHEDFFTKLARLTQMLITFSWYGIVLAVLYHHAAIGKGPVMILWSAVIAVFTGMPFTYFLGGTFLRKIHHTTLQKYETLKRIKETHNKKDATIQLLEKAVDDAEESLYGYYYWFYVFAFFVFTTFWALSVHQLMLIHRNYYYFQHYWLASVAVALGFEHLLLDPILTLLFGNFSFYRMRGFYYDFKLGERFKEIEE